jgi:SpoVK/Ycf46/Vps4 family AAA+-type ATPase
MKKAPAWSFARRMTPKQTAARPLPKRQEIALIDLAKKAKKIPRTRALFSGRNGAGKTLAAEFLARRLDVALFRIDLSNVVSKYIGETEKNLHRLFDAAESSNAILLFDEADTLFGKRSEVKDSHDRYANIEIHYLLQRLEKFRGLAILSCKSRHAVDLAFMPKIQCRLSFRHAAKRGGAGVRKPPLIPAKAGTQVPLAPS